MNPRAKCGVFFCLRARHTSFLYNRGMKHTELFPPFRIEMEAGRPGARFDREKGMVLTDDMLMALYDGNRLKVVSFSLANCLEGEIEKYVAYLAKDEVPFDLNKAAAYIGPALSFSSFPIDDRTAEAFIETAFGSVKGSDGTKRYLDMKVLAALILEKAGVDPRRINISPLCVNEADGILTVDFDGGLRNLYRVEII